MKTLIFITIISITIISIDIFKSSSEEVTTDVLGMKWIPPRRGGKVQRRHEGKWQAYFKVNDRWCYYGEWEQITRPPVTIFPKNITYEVTTSYIFKRISYTITEQSDYYVYRRNITPLK